MILKRVNKQQNDSNSSMAAPSQSSGSNSSGSKTAFIARHAGGLCFDFNPYDSNMYVFKLI
jgi:hypothetical protein